MVFKMIALSLSDYFKVGWNIFDFVVVSLSIMEFAIADKLPEGISVLRTFRLIRLVIFVKTKTFICLSEKIN